MKRKIGESVVGDDFARQDGTVDGILLGATAGAAVGGVIGAGRGLINQSSDQVTEVAVRQNITDPVLQGHRYYVRSDWSNHCTGFDEFRRCERQLDGWWHNYSPSVNDRLIGSYSEPALQHSNPGTYLGSAVAGAAMGAGVGAGLGLAVGVLGKLVGAHPLERKKLPPEVREKLIDDTGNNVAASTALGAGIGATLGLAAGLMEQSGAVKLSRVWQKPVTTSRNIGEIPRNHYEWNHGRWEWGRPGNYQDHSPRGNTPVYRQAPVLDSRGRPEMVNATKNLDSTRFGAVSGLLGGAVMGAGVGFGVGVAASILDRALLQSE